MYQMLLQNLCEYHKMRWGLLIFFVTYLAWKCVWNFITSISKATRKPKMEEEILSPLCFLEFRVHNTSLYTCGNRASAGPAYCLLRSVGTRNPCPPTEKHPLSVIHKEHKQFFLSLIYQVKTIIFFTAIPHVEFKRRYFGYLYIEGKRKLKTAI